ncbi:MAG: molybdopterin molybdotransferase MoeA [Candidatus Eiseniibacteriota bacterium]|jgi:molybdopterin molybdotransferase
MTDRTKPFFRVQTVDAVRTRAARVAPCPAERVELAGALGRSLAGELHAPADLPGFPRAVMDGYAVRSRDTFGTGESSPGYLCLVGEVPMGEVPAFTIVPGECARIGTGGMLPGGADAVVMVEHTRALADGTVEIIRPVAPGGHVLGPTDDAAAGQRLLPAGQRLRPQDLGLLAALGVTEVAVVTRPRVGILSTGDEVVPIDVAPRPGQVRDVNTHTLTAQVAEAGGIPVPMGLVADDPTRLRDAVQAARARSDLLLLSGGSSMGTRDLTVEIFRSFAGAELLVHGVAVAPGKPFIWVHTGAGGPACHLLGLPGQVASCMIAFHLFVEPILERMLGRAARSFTRFARRRATLARNLPSVPGREEYVRVRLERTGGDGAREAPDGDGPDGDAPDDSPDAWRAEPLFGKSGLIRTLTAGHGLVRVPAHAEGLDEGTPVTVLLYP